MLQLRIDVEAVRQRRHGAFLRLQNNRSEGDAFAVPEVGWRRRRLSTVRVAMPARLATVSNASADAAEGCGGLLARRTRGCGASGAPTTWQAPTPALPTVQAAAVVVIVATARARTSEEWARLEQPLER